MFMTERQNIIYQLIKENGAVTVAELVKKFSVSDETVRRDLKQLEDDKLLQRVHGGAISIVRTKTVANYTQRLDENSPLKYELSEYAITLINDGDIIAIDAGTTALEFAEVLAKSGKKVTVITHSLAVFEKLKDISGITGILIGGYFSTDENAFIGPLAINMIKKLHVNKVFIFPSGISLGFGVSDFHFDLALVQQELLGIAENVIVCADSSKFESAAVISLCELSPAHTYVTDSKLPDNIYKLYTENNLKIVKGQDR